MLGKGHVRELTVRAYALDGLSIDTVVYLFRCLDHTLSRTKNSNERDSR